MTRSLTPALVFAAFVVLGAVLLLVSPPGDGSSEHEDSVVEASPAQPREAKLSDGMSNNGSAGDGDALSWSFPPDVTPRFELELRQTLISSDGDEDHTVTTEIDAELEIEMSSEGSVGFLRVVAFDVDVMSDGSPVDLPAVASLLKGIRVELGLDPLAGITTDTPIAATNPQVRRMVSLLVDALRQAHPPLARPEGGETWSADTMWEEDESNGSAITRTISIASINGETAELETEISATLRSQDAPGKATGTLRHSLDRSNGQLVETTGSVAFEQEAESGSLRRTLAVTVRRL